MAFFYFIQCHQSKDRLNDLLNSLYNEEDYFLLHCDKKAPSDLVQFVDALAAFFENVTQSASVYVSWGGFSQSEIMIAALNEFQEASASYSHFIVLSEHHLAVKDRKGISDLFRSGQSFIEWTPFVRMFTGAQHDILHRFCCHYDELPAWGMYPVYVQEREQWVRETVVHGSNWTVLSRKHVDVFLEAFRINTEIYENLSSSIQSDEMLIQTTLHRHLEDASVVNQAATYVAWPHLSGTSDLTFVDANLKEAMEGSYAFIRKRPNLLSDVAASHLGRLSSAISSSARVSLDAAYRLCGGLGVNNVDLVAVKGRLAKDIPEYTDVTDWNMDYTPKIYFSRNVADDVKVVVLSETGRRLKVSCIWERVPHSFRNERVGSFETVLLKARVNFIDLNREIICEGSHTNGFFDLDHAHSENDVVTFVRSVEQQARHFARLVSP